MSKKSAPRKTVRNKETFAYLFSQHKDLKTLLIIFALTTLAVFFIWQFR